jgi:hypothetical protein
MAKTNVMPGLSFNNLCELLGVGVLLGLKLEKGYTGYLTEMSDYLIVYPQARSTYRIE